MADKQKLVEEEVYQDVDLNKGGATRANNSNSEQSYGAIRWFFLAIFFLNNASTTWISISISTSCLITCI